MKTTVAQKAKIGIFTLVGIMIFIAAIFIIGSKRNMFGNTFNIYGTFKNVGGLQIGNNVRFAGIDMGTVEGINIVNDTTIKVTMRLKRKVLRHLKSDAMASIGSDGLMGDKLINISPGAAGDKPMVEGGEIQTVTPVEFDKIINRIAQVADNAEMITASLADIAGQVSSGKGSIGRLIYSDELERSLEKTVKSAHQTVRSAKEGVEGFKENMNAMKSNFLLKGYYKKKERRERKQREAQEQQQNVNSNQR
ncbi:MAG: Mammalian cell entry related domain protein [Flavipsychrobacter sp.]|jgi:phospholipid/cholesterol/gamma-HCH transport system substrate-binding protein|nr:Mammalian cell entry related domain protein [Flavipsychrobacter sp.]